MKRSLPSVSDFAEIVSAGLRKNAKIPVYYGKFLASTATSVSSIMNSSKGRDKICAIIQYTAKMYSCCVENSNIPDVRDKFKKDELVGARVASKIQQSMSDGRKIFRFLKFLDEVKAIIKDLKSQKPIYLRTLMLLSHISAFFFYILDNTLWAIKIGILSEFVDPITYQKWKKFKNLFSFFRNIWELQIRILKLKNTHSKEKTLVSEILGAKNKIIQLEDDSFEIVRALIRKRRKRRFQLLEIIHNGIRLMMLTKSLELPGHKHLNPVFITFMGWVSSWISIFKAAIEKGKIIKIEANNNAPGTASVKRSTRSVSRIFDRSAATPLTPSLSRTDSS